MSQHRQHYFEANFRPEHEPAVERPLGRALAILAVAVAALGTAISTAWPSESATATPVHTTELIHYELPPLAVEDARIEGFRAGLAEGLAQQGCARTLSSPITTR